MLSAILILPFVLGLLAAWKRNPRLNYWLIILHAAAHLGAGVYFLFQKESYPGYLETDALGVFFFFITSVLYSAVAVYNSAFLPGSARNKHTIYSVCLMLFVFAMDGAVFASNLGLVWVFIETTTLASAVLIYHEQTKTALEAAWKYIFICSIGIALAFVGILLLLIAMPMGASLEFSSLYANAAGVTVFWLKIAFIFLLCGFGTKLGLAPLHFWLPDAHSEAVAPVSALLSGALLNTALVPLLRLSKMMNLCGEQRLVSSLFILMGMLSILIAAVFIPRIKNYKRMLAYSSIENMGIATLAFGLGGMAINAGFIHLLGHSLIKAAFFLTAGNIYKIYHDKDYSKVSALTTVHPPSGYLWIFAFAMLAALPPSPLFISEFILFVSLISSGRIYLAAILAIMLCLILFGMGKMVLKISFGKTKESMRLSPALYLPQTALLSMAVLTGLYLLPFVQVLIDNAVKCLEF